MADQVAAPGPMTTVDPRVERRLASAGRLFRWIAVGFSVVAMLGLVYTPLADVPPGPGLLRDTPLASAIALGVLSMGAVIAGGTTGAVSANLGWRRLGLFMCMAAAAFGVFIIYVFIVDMTEIWGEGIAIPAFSLAVILVVLGVAVPLNVSRVDWHVIAGQVCALLAFSLTMSIFLGYAYGDPSVGRLFLQPPISFQASVISVVLAVGILMMRPAAGLLSTASSPVEFHSRPSCR